MFNKLPIRTGTTKEQDHPFKILIIGNSEVGFKRGVYFDSKLFKSLSYKDTQTITGLLTSTDPTGDDGGWTATEFGDFIWLEVEFNISTWPSIKSAKIKSKKKDGASDFGGGEVEHDGGVGTPKLYTQKKARIVLGTIEKDANKNLVVSQLVKTNLRLEQNLTTAKDLNNGDSKIVGVQYLYSTGG